MARTVKRGDLVVVSAAGDYGKPRPAVVIQSDWLKATDSVLVALVTSALVDAPLYRLHIEPSPANGLKATSQVMVDKIVAMPRRKCGQRIGRLDETAMIALNAMLAVVVGLAD
jgi:mRNA interferase MazF